MLAPAVAAIKTRFGRAPRAVTADRGYGEAAIDLALMALGVKIVAIPRRGRPGAARTAIQRKKGFVKLVKWRTGSEARISCLKRDYLWRRTLFDGLAGTQTWCGWGVLTHNSIKIAALSTADDGKQRSRRPPDSEPPTSRPPRTKAA
jgi:transposase, IS5 family